MEKVKEEVIAEEPAVEETAVEVVGDAEEVITEVEEEVK